MKEIQLRRMTMDHVLADTTLLNLPVTFTGSWEQCQSWVKAQGGYVWKNSPKEMFGGYWHQPGGGDCLIPS
jgi:hypothetical protein